MCCHWLGHCFWSRRRLIRSNYDINMNARHLMWRTWNRKEIRAKKASVVPAVPAAASRPPTIGSHQLLFVMLINCFHVHHSLTISLSVWVFFEFGILLLWSVIFRLGITYTLVTWALFFAVVQRICIEAKSSVFFWIFD